MTKMWKSAAVLLTMAASISLPAADPPFRVGVLNFTTIDIQGQKRFLDYQNKPIQVPAQRSLDKGDRVFMSRTMQGFVRLIDAWDSFRTGDANRKAQTEDNRFNRTRAMELYRTEVKGPARPAVIGAEYLAAELGKHGEIFGVVELPTIENAVTKLQSAPDFPRNVMPGLRKMTGATHLLSGTVSDMRSRIVSFKGYNIETRSMIYELDLIVKMTDLASGHTVHSGVYTGTLREDIRPGSMEINNDKFQILMKSATAQAAEDLHAKCRPGRKNQIPAPAKPAKQE